MKKIKYILIIFSIIGTAYFSAIIGYTLYKPLNSEETVVEYERDIANITELQLNAEKEVSKIQIDKITPSTKIIYEYYYKSDDITEIYEDIPPYFLLDLTREDLERQFSDWNIKAFSKKEVVMQKIMEGNSSHHYFVGEYDGYLAIFYEKEINGTRLKEITSMPISALPLEEQEKIKNGINLTGDKELIEFLQDYES